MSTLAFDHHHSLLETIRGAVNATRSPEHRVTSAGVVHRRPLGDLVREVVRAAGEDADRVGVGLFEDGPWQGLPRR